MAGGRSWAAPCRGVQGARVPNASQAPGPDIGEQFGTDFST